MRRRGGFLPLVSVILHPSSGVIKQLGRSTIFVVAVPKAQSSGFVGQLILLFCGDDVSLPVLYPVILSLRFHEADGPDSFR